MDRRSTQKIANAQRRFAVRVRRALRVLLGAAAAGTVALAQPTARHATNIASLLAYPGFYHARPIVIVGKVEAGANEQPRVADDAGSIRVVSQSGAPEGVDEIRGEFWDLGRMKADDPRLSKFDLKKTFQIDPDAPWPKAGEITAIMATSISAATTPAAPSIRAIVLHPSRYLEQKVQVTGQFSGRNLLGDLPDAPAKSRYDFVLRSADAAIWVINMRPKGKDFDLAVDSRMDTNRWLTLRGTVQQGRGLQWIDAEAGSLALASPPTETKEEEQIHVAAGPPPEVIFSAPTQDETEVLQNTNVRVQFSRDIDPATFKGHVRASYMEAQSAERAEPGPPAVDVTTQYNGANRVLEIRFAKPLERFRTIKIELQEGILGTDGQPLKPWTLTFSAGGSH